MKYAKAGRPSNRSIAMKAVWRKRWEKANGKLTSNEGLVPKKDSVAITIGNLTIVTSTKDKDELHLSRI